MQTSLEKPCCKTFLYIQAVVIKYIVGTLTLKNHTMRMRILRELEKMKWLQITGKMKSLTPFCFKAK